jgi:hypothetical protein
VRTPNSTPIHRAASSSLALLVLAQIFSLPYNGGDDDGAANFRVDECREHKGDEVEATFFSFLAANSSRALTVLLSPLVSDLPAAMPSEADIFSKS